MSYCVHCGVELADSEGACPLCGTVVVDPHRLTTAEPAFAEHLDISEGHRLNKRFVMGVVALLLAVPFLVTAIVGWFISANLDWALYVVGAELCLWVFVFLPLLAPKRRPYAFLVADGVAVAALLALIAGLNDGGHWYVMLALPLTALWCIAALLFVYIARRSYLSAGAKVGSILMVLACAVLVTGSFVSVFVGAGTTPGWAWAVFLPCVVLGLAVVLLSRSVVVAEWVRKNLFV